MNEYKEIVSTWAFCLLLACGIAVAFDQCSPEPPPPKLYPTMAEKMGIMADPLCCVPCPGEDQ